MRIMLEITTMTQQTVTKKKKKNRKYLKHTHTYDTTRIELMVSICKLYHQHVCILLLCINTPQEIIQIK